MLGHIPCQPTWEDCKALTQISKQARVTAKPQTTKISFYGTLRVQELSNHHKMELCPVFPKWEKESNTDLTCSCAQSEEKDPSPICHGKSWAYQLLKGTWTYQIGLLAKACESYFFFFFFLFDKSVLSTRMATCIFRKGWKENFTRIHSCRERRKLPVK